MPTSLHADSPGIHKGAYVQSTDPGAIGADKLWVDTSTAAPYLLKRRNAADSGWDAVGLRAVTSADIADGSIVNADINGSAAIAYSKLALASSIVSADIVDGTVATADLAANVVSSRPSVPTGTTTPTTSGNTAMGAFADPTVTISLASAGDILVWMTAAFNDASGGAIISFALRVDSGSWQTVAQTAQPTSAGRWFASGVHLFSGLSAGSHLIEMGRASNANVITYYPETRRILALGMYR